VKSAARPTATIATRRFWLRPSHRSLTLSQYGANRRARSRTAPNDGPAAGLGAAAVPTGAISAEIGGIGAMLTSASLPYRRPAQARPMLKARIAIVFKASRTVTLAS